jgi:hypothetical protein
MNSSMKRTLFPTTRRFRAVVSRLGAAWPLPVCRLGLAALLLALLPLLGRAGTPVLTFQATVPGSAGTDVTAFVDRVEILNTSTGAVVASAVPNASFETFGSLTNGNYGYTPSGASWTFDTRSGIAANGSAFGPPPTTNGSYVAFLQTSSGVAGAFRQTLPALPAGTYQVRAQLAQRNTVPANQGVAILLDGREVGRSVPANDNAYHSYTSAPFVVDAVLRLEATGSATHPGNDVTAFVDMVELLDAGTGAVVPGTPVANPSFETFTGPLSNTTYGYQPAGATWTFVSNSGLAASGSPFNNPTPSPNSNYVAFLQTRNSASGSFSQVVPGALSGTYRLRLQLAQRTNTVPANQGVRVYLNNKLLGTFMPTTTAYQTYTTANFSPLTGLVGQVPAVNVAQLNTGGAGSGVSLYGSNLDQVTTMLVNGVQAVINASYPTSLLFTVPAGGSTVQRITLNYPGGQVFFNNFELQLLIRSTSPAANADAGPVANSAVGVTYSEPVTVTSPASTMRVFSAQVGGRKAGTATINGSTLQFTSTLPGTRANFMPGEVVGVTVPAVQSAGGLMAPRRVFQFTTATSGPGTGNYSGSDLTVSGYPTSVVVGDVDGDGDLDAVTPTYGGTVNVHLNDGTATLGSVYSNVTVNSIGSSPSLALGDVDGDGDLDLVAANSGGPTPRSGTVSVRLNLGWGVFSGGSEVTVVGRPEDIALGDVDGDGDLDLLTSNDDAQSRVSIRLNDGTGTFAGGSDPPMGVYSLSHDGRKLAVGDLDGDGDLDLVATNYYNYQVNVGINDGAGGIVWATDVSVGVPPFISRSGPVSVTLGDVDGDGDLDIVAGTVGSVGSGGAGSSFVSVRLNSGAASFANSGNTDLAVSDYPTSVALGDADADGDLDLFAGSYNASMVNMRLNNGAGVFTAGSSNTGVFSSPNDIALGDMDGDGDLDFVTSCSNVSNIGNNKLSVRLNRAPPPTITSFSPSSGAAGTVVTITGMGLAGVSQVTVNGELATNVTPVDATHVRFTVPIRATANQVVTVASVNGVSAPSTGFTVLLRVTFTSPAANARSAPTPNSAVALTFSEPVAEADLQVFSAQAGGRKAGTTVINSRVVRYTSTLSGGRANFLPGELVNVTVPNTARNEVYGLVGQKQVFQFTAATSGTGRGYFNGGSDPLVGSDPSTVAVGDVDGDGDLDLLTTGNGTVSVRLNDGTGTYAGGSDPAVNGTANAVAVGDVDGDGDLDFVTTNTPSNTVSVRLNNGAGTFGGGSDLVVGTFPASVALGDVDGDGDLDIVTANLNGNTVSVRLNSGTGTFAGGSDPAVGINPISVVLGDVDNDGDLDLLTASSGSNAVSVRLNDGAGTFAGGSDPVVSAGPSKVAVGDLDGDGDLDLVTASNSNGMISVRFNNGAGVFSGGANTVIGNNLFDLVLGDVDADGDLDLFTASANVSGTVIMRYNNGAGVFGSGADPAVGRYPTGLVLGDVDGDGDLDLLTANNGGATVSVRLNQAPPIPTISGFSPTSGVAGTSVALTGTNLTGTSVVTVNGVAVTPTNVSATGLTFVVPAGTGNTQRITVTTAFSPSAPSAAFTVLLRVAATSPVANARTAPVASSAVSVSFTEPVTVASAANIGVFSAQLGGRKTGTATVSGNTLSFRSTQSGFQAGEMVSVSVPPTVLGAGGLALSQPRVWQFTTAVGGTGIGNFQPPIGLANPAVGSTPQGVALGDVNNDGKLDLLTANSGGNTVSIRYNNGQGDFSTSTSVTVGNAPYGLALADVDGDGKPDLLATNSGSNTVSIRLNINATSGGGTTVAVGSRPYGLAVGDVDGDGDLDLLTANNGGTTVSVRLNNGAGIFSGNTSVSVGTAPVGVALGDVDNDGDLDLLATNSGSNTVSIRLNDGTGSFSGSANVPVGINPQGLAVGDVDADGDLDLLAANRDDNTVSIRLNNGLGVFANGSDPGVGTNPQGLTVGDVDADGDLDLLAANNGGTTVSIRLNDGAGTFGSNPDAVAGGTPYAVALADVDADGDLDLVTTNSDTGTASVRLNQPPRPTISSFSPASGAAGATITLTGTYLTGATSLVVNGVSVTPTAVTATSLRFVVPAGASNAQSVSVTTPFGIADPSTAFAVLLRTTATSPVANAKAVNNSPALNVTFTEPVTAASAANVGVFSAQLGGRKAGTITPSGNTISYRTTLLNLREYFRAGEVVSVSVPPTVLGAGGLALSRPKVFQFTIAAPGPGRGTFQALDPALRVGAYPYAIAAGDVDGDGDLDLLTTNQNDNTVSVCLNDGIGTFGNITNVSVGNKPYALVLGDVDGDGDLDFATANYNSSTVSVRLNNGSGIFSGSTELAVGNGPQSVALADMDADGDLDVLAASFDGSQLHVRFNNGTGSFVGGTDSSLNELPYCLAVGDLDNDGDLDVVSGTSSSTMANVSLNDGTGRFVSGPDAPVNGFATSVALGDLDDDGDLDLVASNYLGNTVSVRFNNGSGTFSGNSNPAVAGTANGVTLGDVDGDGDLDLLAALYNANGGVASVRLNNGSGTFAGGSDPVMRSAGMGIVAADFDNDGDLDFATANYGTSRMDVRINQSASAPSVTGISPAAELPGQTVTVTGINFTTSSSVSFGGVRASSVQYLSATSLRAVLPAGATPGTSSVAVTTANGRSATSTAPFEVLQVYRGTADRGWSFTFDATVTGSGGPGSWVYLRALNFAGGGVVAAIEDTRNLGTVRVDYAALGTATTTAVRRDQEHYYLDRNFYLTATNKTFPGRSVRVRFFGLTSELARLTAADPTATAARLKAWQYSGPNEDCNLTSFTNNAAPPTGEYRLLSAPATIMAGADWFTSEVTVADHFSEFYLTGTATPPLPVELVEFTAQTSGPAAVRLAWTTASEKNSARFEVERSVDGMLFGKIGEVAAAGTSSSARRYGFDDNQLPKPQKPQDPIYYRLRQVDLDGTSSYSPVRAVTRPGAVSAFTLYPNPARTAATVVGVPASAGVEVLDALGRRVAYATADATGTAVLALPSTLAAGVYLVRCGTQTQRLAVTN